MASDNAAEDIRSTLRGIVGLRLVGSRNFCATRHFYFGNAAPRAGVDHSHYLGVECPWRIRRLGLIVVGSDDYYAKAEANDDPSWEPGMPGGHLQDERLAESLGEFKEGEIITTHPGLTVKDVELDGCGDIRIELEANWVLEVFPDGAKRMQWIFTSPDRPSLILMDGVVNKSRRESSEAE